MKYDTEERERAFARHTAREGPAYYDVHPDGCFYCGGDHVSDVCRDREAVDQYWRLERKEET